MNCCKGRGFHPAAVGFEGRGGGGYGGCGGVEGGCDGGGFWSVAGKDSGGDEAARNEVPAEEHPDYSAENGAAN